MSNEISNRVETVTLYEEYRLIEKDEAEINAAWRGVHLLLFFLAFVFGSFCTFCFHMLMYLFDEKCVLFPKLISLKEMGKGTGTVSNKLLYDYISDSDPDALPVDFVSTHWVEKSTCYLPTYAPLLSGICGLIWTTMFVMCSSGSRSLTGLQRPWRILPTVFVFSLVMGGFSMYTSFITQAGLEELCLKLSEITGSKTCSYTINVATLAYERRIRGVYQATRLTIMSAWLHTFCWIGAAFTALLRMILVVDFRLVKVQVDLRGNIEKMLERHEKHIRTDEYLNKDDLKNIRRTGRTSTSSVKVRFVNKGFSTEPQSLITTVSDNNDFVTNEYISPIIPIGSKMSLQTEEYRKLLIRSAAATVDKKHRFVVEILHDIVDNVGSEQQLSAIRIKTESDIHLHRQKGISSILRSFAWSSSSSSETDESTVNREEAKEVAQKFRRHFLDTSASKRVASVRKLPKRRAQMKMIEKNTSPQIVNRRNTSKTSVQTLIPHIQSIILPLVENENTMIIPPVTSSQEIEKLTTSSFKKVDTIEHKDVQDREQIDDATVKIWKEIKKKIAEIRSSKSLVNIYLNPQKPGPSYTENKNLTESPQNLTGSKNSDVLVDSKPSDPVYSESETSKEQRSKTIMKTKSFNSTQKEKQD